MPTPGVDGAAVIDFFAQQSSGLFGMFNTFTGGALERFSVMALGIMPYISASIIFSVVTVNPVPQLEQLKRKVMLEEKTEPITSVCSSCSCFGSRLGYGVNALSEYK
ncbi:MAG: hypothetical protein R2827_14100 [Bdellovibrionales bacterium]